MDAAAAAELVAGRGLRGNATQGGRRQVTIMSLDRWQALTAHLPGPPAPAVRRANLLVDGVDLDDSRGRVLRIGDARVRIFGETRPCHQMDEACPGLQAALSPPWGGGAFGEVIESGAIAVGAPVAWEDRRAGRGPQPRRYSPNDAIASRLHDPRGVGLDQLAVLRRPIRAASTSGTVTSAPPLAHALDHRLDLPRLVADRLDARPPGRPAAAPTRTLRARTSRC